MHADSRLGTELRHRCGDDAPARTARPRGPALRGTTFAVGTALCLLLPALTAQARAEVTPQQLQARIDGLVREIEAEQDASGAFGIHANPNWAVGQTALGVMSLRAAGVPANNPAVRKAAMYLLEHSGEGGQGVYQVSLKIMALESVDPKAYLPQIELAARYLMRAQQDSGGWSYTESGTTDNSNSQFALLGLNSAAQCGVDVPDVVWQRARQDDAAGQNRDGGWHYRSRAGESYGSMTAAGVASLYICETWLHIKSGRCGVYLDERNLDGGLAWMASHFSVTRNPGNDMWKFYYLYALERVGVILAQRYFGQRDWYREGVEHLVGDPTRMVAAPSRYEWPLLQNCFMLLFLAKGNAPILVHKAQWAGQWNTNRYDAKFLVQYVGKQLDQTLDWQMLPLSAPLDQLMAAPILYVSGSGAARWQPAETQGLKGYVDAGGFVLVEAANADGVFDGAFRAAVQQVFPDDQLVRLPKDHPIYTAYFDIPLEQRPPLEAITGPCWISVLYAPQGLSCQWDIADFGHVNFKMGVNIVAYVTGLQKLEGKLVRPSYYVPTTREAEPRRGAFTLGQVVHGNDWRPHKVAWVKVLEQLNQKAGLQVYSQPLPIRLDVESPFQAQMLYITGVQTLTLNADERKALKLYVERGGFIFAEAACGSKQFDESFRRIMKEVFPGQELKVLPVGHALFEAGEPLGNVSYSPAVRRDEPDLKRPFLEFIEQNGRAVVVYSKYDLSSAIDGHPCFTCASVIEPSASRLVLKIALYGLSS